MPAVVKAEPPVLRAAPPVPKTCTPAATRLRIDADVADHTGGRRLEWSSRGGADLWRVL
jgi:hypothetical protein